MRLRLPTNDQALGECVHVLDLRKDVDLAFGVEGWSLGFRVSCSEFGGDCWGFSLEGVECVGSRC